jgi:hypothetical protein
MCPRINVIQMRKFIIYTFVFYLCCSQAILAQSTSPVRIISQVAANSTRLDEASDGNILYATPWSQRVLKLDGNLNPIWNLRVTTGKPVVLNGINTGHDNYYLYGEQVIHEGPVVYEDNIYITLLDECLQPQWAKLMGYRVQFNDTIFDILGYKPGIFSSRTDEHGNFYWITLSEDLHLQAQDSMGNYGMIYKFNTKGDLVFRKRILDVAHSGGQLRIHEIRGGVITIVGDSYFPNQPGDNITWYRAVLALMDTSGNLIDKRIYREDTQYVSTIYDIDFNPVDSSYIGIMSGMRRDTVIGKRHVEIHFVKWDNSLNIVKDILSSETDSIFYKHTQLRIDPEGNAIVYLAIEYPYEHVDYQQRRNIGYFVKYDKDLNFIDSVKIDYLTYKSFADSTYDVFSMNAHPQDPSVTIVSGRRRFGPFDNYHSMAFKINSNLQIDTVTYPVLPNDTLCNTTLSGDIVRQITYTDTLIFITRVHKNYNNWNSVNEQVAPPQITLSPNPATTQVHITSPVKIESYTLNNTSGTQVQSGVLEHDNNIDITQLPQGIYFLQLQLENGQRVVKKLVRSY